MGKIKDRPVSGRLEDRPNLMYTHLHLRFSPFGPKLWSLAWLCFLLSLAAWASNLNKAKTAGLWSWWPQAQAESLATRLSWQPCPFSQRRTEPVFHLCIMLSKTQLLSFCETWHYLFPERNEWLNGILWFTEVGSWQVGSWHRKRKAVGKWEQAYHPRSFKMPTPHPPYTLPHTHTHTRKRPHQIPESLLNLCRAEVVVSEPRAP